MVTKEAMEGVKARRMRYVGAGFLNFFVPGIGHFFIGRPMAALLWLFTSCLGYVCFIVPGLILHVCCIIHGIRCYYYSPCPACRSMIPQNAIICKWCRTSLADPTRSEAA